MANEKSVMALIRASRPSFRNNHDKIAFAVHASFLASGYVLTATGRLALADDTLSSSSVDEVGVDGWNELNDEYAFVYVNPEKVSKKVLVKGLVMNDKLLVDALGDGKAEPVHIEIDVGDYVKEDGGTNYSAHFKDLDKLVSSLDKEILRKVQGGSGPSSSSSLPSEEPTEASRSNVHEPGLGFGGHSGPQIHPSGVVLPPVNPIGGSDLFPGPGAGVYPGRGDIGGGGMLVGPNDPRWSGGYGGQPGFFGPPPGIPPGARFDPFGPPDVPGFEPRRFMRRPPARGGGTHPDVQHFHNDPDFI